MTGRRRLTVWAGVRIANAIVNGTAWEARR
jgi:hypothetical protein